MSEYLNPICFVLNWIIYGSADYLAIDCNMHGSQGALLLLETLILQRVLTYDVFAVYEFY